MFKWENVDGEGCIIRESFRESFDKPKEEIPVIWFGEYDKFGIYLNQEDAQAILPQLQFFAEHGKLPEGKEEEDDTGKKDNN